MLVNIIIAFIIPWIFGVYLYLKDRRIIILIGPFASVLAFTIDVIGFQLDYWHIKPFYDTEIFSALPFHWGIYPILTGYLIYFIMYKRFHRYLLITGFALITTILELIGVLTGRVVYHNGWNIFFTFGSYLLPYTLTYLYFKKLRSMKILTD